MNNRILNILKYILGWPFSLIALFFIIKLILPQISQFSSYVSSFNFTFLFYAIISFLFFYLTRSYLWYQLTKLYSKKISFKKSNYFWAISELKRYIPGNIWSYVGRALLFEEAGIKKKDTGKLIIVESGILVLSSLFISLLSLPFISTYFFPFITYDIQVYIFLFTIIILTIFIFNQKIAKILPPFSVTENILLLFISSVSCIFFGFGHYFTVASIANLPPQLFIQLSGFFVLSWMIGYLTLLTPAGFGVREGAIITGLSKIIPSSLAAVLALFCRIILVISEVIFVGFSYLFYKTKNKYVKLGENWVFKHPQDTSLVLLFLVYVIYFSIASFYRYENFYAGKFDLGNMVQTVWNTTQGRVFTLTNPDGVNTISRLGVHSDFILAFLAPFYALWPDPKNLLFIQTLVVAAGCFFVFAIAKDILKNKNLALMVGFSYLLNPSIQRANLYDFHAVTLATTFLLGAYYFFNKKRYVYFAIFAFLAAITKEQVWLIIAVFGIFMFFRHNKKLAGSMLFLACCLIFYFLVAVAIPNSLGSTHFALSNYSEFGNSPLQIIQTIFTSPQKIISIVFQQEKMDYLVQILSPLGYLSVLSPFLLIFIIPDLAVNLLSLNPQFYQIYYQYTATISPFLFISAIYSIALIKKYLPKIPVVILLIYIAFTTLIGAYRYGPLPGAKSPYLDMFTNQVKERKFISEYLSSIPQNKSVASSNNLGAHLSEREQIYVLPTGIDKADIVIFFLNEKLEYPESLKTQKIQIEKIRNNTNYELSIERGEFVVFIKK